MHMSQGVRESLGGKPWFWAIAVIGILAVALAVWTYKRDTGESEMAALSSHRMFIDADSLKAFPHELKIGESLPVISPFSGKATGYPAEACYWTKEGTAKETPTYVLLNETVGKPGPTFCPECGRLVTAHNPRP